MKTISLSDTTAIEELIAAVDEDDVVLLREGKPVALLSAFDVDDLEWYSREHDHAFLDSIARARQQIEAGKAVSHEELKRQMGVE